MSRWRSLLRPGPALGAIIALVVLVLLGFGLLSKARSSIDNNLVKGKPTAAPGFKLPVLIADQPAIAPRLRRPELRTSATPSSSLARRLRSAVADGQIDLSELRGLPVVLNFWASWCDPCREEAPMLKRGWGRDSRRGVLYLGLNVQDLTDGARNFLREFGINYPTIRDQQNTAPVAYGAIGIPETYFIDRRGRVVGHIVGKVTPRTLATGVQAARTGQVIGILRGPVG